MTFTRFAVTIHEISSFGRIVAKHQILPINKILLFVHSNCNKRIVHETRVGFGNKDSVTIVEPANGIAFGKATLGLHRLDQCRGIAAHHIDNIIPLRL